MQIEIKYLKDCEEHIPALAKLWFEELRVHWIKGVTLKKTEEELKAHAQKNKLPLAVAALHQGLPVGMACLRDDDGLGSAIKPWLGSLVVHPLYRQKKVGERLIEAVKAHAKAQGDKTLYLLAFDPTLPGWYQHLGWQYRCDGELLGHPVTVMQIALATQNSVVCIKECDRIADGQ